MESEKVRSDEEGGSQKKRRTDLVEGEEAREPHRGQQADQPERRVKVPRMLASDRLPFLLRRRRLLH